MICSFNFCFLHNCEVLHTKKSKYLVKGIKSYSDLKNFSYKKQDRFDCFVKTPFTKMTGNLSIKGVT